MRTPRLSLRSVVLTLAFLGLPTAAVAVCVAVIGSGISVNGVVVSTALPAAPGGCMGDLGWAGVAARPFVHIDGTPSDPAESPRMMLAGFGAPLQRFYVGIHLPFDPDLRRDDRLTLYFDANNSGGDAFDNGDFALVFGIGKATPVNSSESCDSLPGQIEIYRHNGSVWGSPSTSVSGVTSRFAFDYDPEAGAGHDLESGIWELEIELNAATLGLAAAGFRVGAKLYPHEVVGGDDTWQSWMWPAGLTTEADPWLYYPGDGNVTPADLEPVTFAGCADVEITAISATSPSGGNNTFRRPSPADWSGSGPSATLPVNRRNNFTASVRFFNPSNPADNSPVSIPNAGQVEFLIRPWGSGAGFLDEEVMQNPTVSFNHMGQTQTVSFQWPIRRSDYTPIETAMNQSHHSCLKVSLSGFSVNLNPEADVQNRNLTYTTLSTRVDTFLVSTRTDSIRKQQPIDFILRSRWENLPPSLAGGWKYRFLNAGAMGLRDLGNGYYSFQMGPQQDQQIVIEMTGGNMPISSQRHALDPKAGGAIANPADGGPPLRVPVRVGQTVTIVAEGQIQVLRDTTYNGADGRDWKEFTNQRFLLGNRAYAPHQHTGAIIGSFDAGRTWFVVGADGSFHVPAQAQELWLAVNDVLGQYADNRAGPYTLYVVISEPRHLPTTLATTGNPAVGQPPEGEPGANLPQLDIDIFQAVPVPPRPGQPRPPSNARLLLPFTYVSYAVYATHVGDDPDRPPTEPTHCGSRGMLGLGAFAGVSILGLMLVRRGPRGRRPRRA